MTNLPGEPLGEYTWPPLPVDDPDEAARIFGARMQAAYDDLEATRLRALAQAQASGRVPATWMRDFQAEIVLFQQRSAAEAEALIRNHIEGRYQAGAAVGGQATWTVAHARALESLSTDTYGDFLRRAQEAARVSMAFARAVRAAAGPALTKIAAGGTTARQGGKALADLLRDDYGVTHVTYADGTDVPVRAYAEMAARTKSAVAYNAGTLNELHAQGVGYVEVFDGAACGWSSHRDGDLANGSIRTVADAAAHPISHPNCRRGFGPRPDITTDEEAATASPSTSAEQREDAVLFEAGTMRPAERARLLASRPAQEARAARTARRTNRQ